MNMGNDDIIYTHTATDDDFETSEIEQAATTDTGMSLDRRDSGLNNSCWEVTGAQCRALLRSRRIPWGDACTVGYIYRDGDDVWCDVFDGADTYMTVFGVTAAELAGMNLDPDDIPQIEHPEDKPRGVNESDDGGSLFDADAEMTPAELYIRLNGKVVPPFTKRAMTATFQDWDDAPTDITWTLVRDDKVLHDGDILPRDEPVDASDVMNDDYGGAYVLLYGDDWRDGEHIYNLYARELLYSIAQNLNESDDGGSLFDADAEMTPLFLHVYPYIGAGGDNDKAREMGWRTYRLTPSSRESHARCIGRINELFDYNYSPESVHTLCLLLNVGHRFFWVNDGDAHDTTAHQMWKLLDALDYHEFSEEELLAMETGAKSRLRVDEAKEDLSRFRAWCGDDDLYDDFLRDKGRLEHRDIYYWMRRAPGELRDELDSLGDTARQSREEAMLGAENVYSDDFWDVYRIDTPEASRLLGKGTKWCVSGDKVINVKVDVEAGSEAMAKVLTLATYHPVSLNSVEQVTDTGWDDVWEADIDVVGGNYYFWEYADTEGATLFFMISRPANVECHDDARLSKVAIKLDDMGDVTLYDAQDNEIRASDVPNMPEALIGSLQNIGGSR